MKDKSVLVTGAGGSIGSVLCHEIVKRGARRLTLVSLTEGGLYEIERKLRGSSTEIVGILGSVCDYPLMCEALSGVDIVIHAAAHKHVPICERNPIAAIENNVRGTLSLATAAENSEVSQFVLISSDKAVKPTSVMGATKRVAEMILRSRAGGCTRFSIVRFGNVLDSAGSVLPLWREQIAMGGPVTLTDERCERYFMSIPEACELVLAAIGFEEAAKDVPLYVFDMGEPVRLAELAQRLISNADVPIEIKYIGLRPGEKLTEELHYGGEVTETQNPKILRVIEPLTHKRMLIDELLQASSCRKSDLAVRLLMNITTNIEEAAA